MIHYVTNYTHVISAIKGRQTPVIVQVPLEISSNDSIPFWFTTDYS